MMARKSWKRKPQAEAKDITPEAEDVAVKSEKDKA